MTNALTTTNWTIPNRRLLSFGSVAALDENGYVTTQGEFKPFHLESVRDTLKRIEEKQDPRDYTRTLNQLLVGFMDGHATGLWMNPNGEPAEQMLFSRNGLNDLAGEILPARGLATIKKLATTSGSLGTRTNGEELATTAWNWLAQVATDKDRLVRTVNMNVGTQSDPITRRVIRACRSTNYGVYSNLDMVNDLLDAGYGDKKVLNWVLEDDRMRLRFLLSEQEVELNKIVPMAEVSNSETGRGKVRAKGGGFVLSCTNGMGSYQENYGSFGWNHTGDVNRIRVGFGDALENITVAANGIVDMYQRSLEVAVSDLHALIMGRLGGAGFSENVQKRTVALLQDPTTTADHVLGAAIDAITLSAQSEGDLILQEKLEREATRLMDWGLAEGAKNGGAILSHN